MPSRPAAATAIRSGNRYHVSRPRRASGTRARSSSSTAGSKDVTSNGARDSSRSTSGASTAAVDSSALATASSSELFTSMSTPTDAGSASSAAVRSSTSQARSSSTDLPITSSPGRLGRIVQEREAVGAAVHVELDPVQPPTGRRPAASRRCSPAGRRRYAAPDPRWPITVGRPRNRGSRRATGDPPTSIGEELVAQRAQGPRSGRVKWAGARRPGPGRRSRPVDRGPVRPPLRPLASREATSSLRHRSRSRLRHVAPAASGVAGPCCRIVPDVGQQDRARPGPHEG